MRSKKRNTGVITFHTPVPVSMFKSEECMAYVKDATGRRESPSQPRTRTRSTSKCVRVEKGDEASSSGPRPDTKQACLSHASLRRLQAKMEAENQQVKDIIQPLLATENGFVKGLESFLSRRDVTELRRRELLHKRWTESVWFPLQRRVEEHVSSCSPVAAKKRLSLYSDYIHHYNTKGFVSLDVYDPREYDPLLLHIKKPHFFKLSTADLKDPLYLQLHERLKRTDRSCESGCKYTRRQVEKLPQSARPLSEFATSLSDTLLQASSNRRRTASRKTPVEDETEGRSSRLDTVPYHIRATATPDGWCHHTGCWFSRCGRRPQPANSDQLQSSPTSE
ncbi:protein FAM228A isoform X2 [Sebastes umbrosus]|uniref:protein FAM228A isoform X2 n=1 Tax=Sebastes umbrosus TaxID=72105 RepID=UPI00189ECC25|nr:protein FAM228A isoform X2 [Sebastes umbrosus]